MFTRIRSSQIRAGERRTLTHQLRREVRRHAQTEGPLFAAFCAAPQPAGRVEWAWSMVHIIEKLNASSLIGVGGSGGTLARIRPPSYLTQSLGSAERGRFFVPA
jgi:hypothetical protein